ncbi:putative porin [uncultured Bacteroides sp.]|uniref:putative porin n=1 Tax=uncultured Bacteroides sp. TaxID=162156 RepID=UPI002623684E|nr:putative porin [uncultured Bacteroides sp.]
MRKIFILATIVMICCAVSAQNQLSPLTNQFGRSASGADSDKYDRNGNLIDTTAVNDASTIPVGLYSWTIDPRFGNRTEVPIDTLQHDFQNSNDTGGPTGHYTYLGNLGSPRISHVFFDRKDPTQFFFLDPYDFTVIRPETVVYTNTKSPFANLTYYKQGTNRDGEERFKSYFAVNANKRMGFGFNIDYVYGRGKYDHQSTAFFNGNLFAYYLGDKYNMHFNFINDNLKMAENGGITDERYIRYPLDMAEGGKKYKNNEIPTNLSNVWNHNTGYHAFLTQRYNLGFYRDKETITEKDTLTVTEYVPVTSFLHTINLDINKRRYISKDEKENKEYYLNQFLPDVEKDIIDNFSVKNTIGIELREGFNKWAKAGLTAFATHEFRRFNMVDSLSLTPDSRYQKKYIENVVSVGGQLIKEQGRLLHYNVTGEVAVLGEDAGQFQIEGNGDLNFKLFNDTVRLDVKAYIKNQNPTFFFRHFHSKHYWWDNDDLSKVMRTRVEGKLTIDRWKTRLSAGVENIKNYTYLDNVSVPYTTTTGGEENITYLNNLEVRQCSDNIQVFSATLRQDFKFGIFHLDNEVTYQKSSKQDVLPLPDLVLYHNLYLRFALAKKVLQVEIGADLRYFSEYYAPDYTPGIGQFHLQNKDTRYKLGGYPMVNGYINIHLKRTRFFIQMYNLFQGQGEKSYIFSPHYPLNPRILKLGLSWNFFD